MTQCIPYPLNEFIIEGRHVAFGSQAKNYEHWVGQLKAEFSSGWRNKVELNKQLREVMNHVPQGVSAAAGRASASLTDPEAMLPVLRLAFSTS